MGTRIRFDKREDRELYEHILAAQDGRCAICRRPPEARKLSFDHNHQTNQIRGLLCTRCNSGLGYFRENIESFLHAIEYLDAPNNYGEIN